MSKKLLKKIYWIFEEMMILQRIDRTFHIEELERISIRVIYSDLPQDVCDDYVKMIADKINSLRQAK